MPNAQDQEKSDLDGIDFVILWGALPLWIVVLLAGTLVNSQPYRDAFAAFGGLASVVVNGLKVTITYTLTNVCVLCLIASLLGMVGAKAKLGADSDHETGSDTTSPRISALLRGFFVYLALIAGVLVMSDSPIAPSQVQYVKLAGLMSLTGFVVNYRPTLFGELLARAFRGTTEAEEKVT
jgi:hypothetical protein